MARILLLEDDAQLRKWVAKGLGEKGHTVDTFFSGAHALTAATQETYDLLILDRMVPDVDGLKLLKTLRAIGDKTAVLLVTALSGADERVEVFEAGCDDYMVKPFAFIELLARVGMLLGRSSEKASGTAARLAAGELSIDLLSRECFRQGQKIRLTSTEFKLL